MKFNKMKTSALLVSSVFAFSMLVGCAGDSSEVASEEKQSINVYNWGDYIDEELLTQFTDETGIEVVYDTFASNEDMYVKIKSGGAKYDVAIPSEYMIEKMINEDMLLKIDFENIPNYVNINDKFKNLPFDPNNEYSVPYMWGTLGILYNTDMVIEPVDSWDIMWDPKYEGQIYMYDSQRDSIGVALKKLGYSLNTTDVSELEEAKQLLIEQKPLVQAYVGDPVKDKMIGNEGALAVVYSGDAVYCMEENPSLQYAVPKEGSNAWYDSMVIPVGAENQAGGEAFINFMCDPEVALKNTEYIGYSTTNQAAYQLLTPEVQNNEVYWPSDETFNSCEVFSDLGDFIKEYDRIWTEVLASN